MNTERPVNALNECDDTKNRIIKVALELFAREGFDAISTRKIAQLARCNIASLNYHFGTKKKLYYECLWQMKPKDLEVVKSTLKRAVGQDDIRKKLLSFCEAFAAYVSTNASSLKLLINEVNADAEEPVKDTFLLPVREALEQFLLDAQTDQIIQKSIEPGLFTTMVMSVIISQKLFKSFKSYEDISNDVLARKIVLSCTYGFFSDDTSLI